MEAYQALLTRPENVAQTRAQRRAIEEAGGKLEIEPPTPTGMVVVTLWLPSHRRPNEFLPGLPFYPL